jgi:hypothetical protein
MDMATIPSIITSKELRKLVVLTTRDQVELDLNSIK